MRSRLMKGKAAVLALAMGLSAILGSASPASADDDGPKIYYKDGFHIDSADGNYAWMLNLRLQSRLTYTAIEAGKDLVNFSIPRGEIRMEGNVFTTKLKYGFEMGFGTRVGSKTAPVCADATCSTTVNAVVGESTTGLPVLNDYYFDWQPMDQVQLKFGQFKVPFLYTELVSAMKLEFPDRSVTNNIFSLARDLGLDLHGNLFDYHLGYHFFIMNGDGANTIHSKREPMIGARFEVPIIGDYKYSESDVDYTEEPALGLGVAYLLDDRGSSFENGTIPANVRASHGTIDLHFRSHGFFALGQGMLSRVHQGAKLTNFGFNAQAGYFIIPKHLEVAARASSVVFSNAIPNQYEYGACLGYYFNKHNLKLQTDYALLMNQRGLNLNDHQFRTQLTMVF
ncbi:MAG TPA: porin [bacterium]|nr:porin [bacterium]